MNNDFIDAVPVAEGNFKKASLVLLVDVSGSMHGTPIQELNAGLQALQKALNEDVVVRNTIEISIIAFGAGAQQIIDFTPVYDFNAPILDATGGRTDMGRGIKMALDVADQRKDYYKQNAISYYQPWIYMITDGGANDEISEAQHRVQQLESQKKVNFWNIAVDGADELLLKSISPRTLKLKGLNFRELFIWIAKSMHGLSQSKPGDSVQLPKPDDPDLFTVVA